MEITDFTLTKRGQIQVAAASNGWKSLTTSRFSWWTFEFAKGTQRLLVRQARNGRVTALTHTDGSGVILQVTTKKFENALSILRGEE